MYMHNFKFVILKLLSYYMLTTSRCTNFSMFGGNIFKSLSPRNSAFKHPKYQYIQIKISYKITHHMCVPPRYAKLAEKEADVKLL